MSVATIPRRPGRKRLTRTARAVLIERLHEEFDLLCLGIPSAWRIKQAIAQAEGALA